MTLDTILSDTNGASFHDVPCPHCGVAETLDVNISDFWNCEHCGRDFWITPLTLVSSTPPRTERNRNGEVVAIQISLGYLSLFPHEYREVVYDDDSDS